MISVIDAIDDPVLFGPWFRDPETWVAWRTFLKVLFGLPLEPDEAALYERCTGRSDPVAGGGPREVWLVCGRRAGKSFILALVAVYLAVFADWRPYLTIGERGVVQVIASDRRQARVIFRYMRALIVNVPMIRALVERETREAIDLANGLTIEIQAASFRGVRGYTLVAALLDEVAFWRDERSANPDVEVLNAIRPALATIPASRIFCASSPYARRGVLWDAYRRHFGREKDPVLVWRADTRTMNPTVPERIIAEAYEADPASASAEYGAEFRADIETYIAREVVDAAVMPGRFELSPMLHFDYFAAVDPSGGSADAFTLAIGHREGDVIVIDAARERLPPFSPDQVVREYATLLRAYRVSRVTGDRYAGEWPRERFRAHGIEYRLADAPKSDLYRDLLPLLNSRRIELLDHPRLVAQLCLLERRTARGGRDSIDHPVGGHDDVANVVAGLAALATRRRTFVRPAEPRWMPPAIPIFAR